MVSHFLFSFFPMGDEYMWMFLCLQLHMHLQMSACLSVHVGAGVHLKWHCSGVRHKFTHSLWPASLTTVVGQWPAAPACLCLPSTEIVSVHHHTRFLYRFWKLYQSSVACIATTLLTELLSSTFQLYWREFVQKVSKMKKVYLWTQVLFLQIHFAEKLCK